MDHLKIISSAAYLKIHKCKNEQALFAEIILPNKEQEELFYNKEKGFEIINEAFKKNKIMKEEFEYLKDQIKHSSLMDKSHPINDEFFKSMRGLADMVYCFPNSQKVTKYIKDAMAQIANKNLDKENNCVLVALIERNINLMSHSDNKTIH